jgi:hypothetical protein
MLLDLDAIFDPDRRLPPIHETVDPADWHLLCGERAAIMEYDGGLSLEHAERAAFIETQKVMKSGRPF